MLCLCRRRLVRAGQGHSRIVRRDAAPSRCRLHHAEDNGGKVPTQCFVYVGGGWYAPGKGIPELCDEMQRHLDAGYTMLKMKVGGAPLAEDMRRIEAVKRMLPKGAELAVDANSKFELQEALAYAKAMAPFALRWFEEPCDPLDFATLAEISEAYPH